MSASVSIGGQSVLSRARPAKVSLFGLTSAFIFLCFLAFLAWLVWWGGSYYATPLEARHLHPHHQALRPSGTLGHAMGVTGTFMMLLIFVYSLRKRWALLQRIGKQAQWLQVHIFLGLAGPILVTFHTSGKLGGIVSVAFYSMWAVVVSGVIGRYLYAKIPRTLQGNKMSLKEIEDQLSELVDAVRADEKREAVLAGIEAFLSRTRRHGGGLLRALFRVLLDDARLPLRLFEVWRIVGADRALSLRQRARLTRLILRQRRLLNHLAVLDASQRLFSMWHVFHKPFTVLTFVIVSLHVAVAVYLGYGLKW
jgi:hypothetical protein